MGQAALERGPVGQRPVVAHPDLRDGEFADIVEHAFRDPECPRRMAGGRHRHEAHPERRRRAPLGCPGEELEGTRLRHEHVGGVVVVATGSLEPLNMPSVSEHDLITRDDRDQQWRDTVIADHQFAVDGRHEASGDVLRMPGARSEVPGPGDPVAAVDRGTHAVRKELSAHGHSVVVGGEHLCEPLWWQIGGTGGCRGEVGNADPAQRAVLPCQFDPCFDHLGERRLRPAGFGRVEVLHQSAAPQCLDRAGGQCPVALTGGRLFGGQVPKAAGCVDRRQGRGHTSPICWRSPARNPAVNPPSTTMA